MDRDSLVCILRLIGQFGCYTLPEVLQLRSFHTSDFENVTTLCLMLFRYSFEDINFMKGQHMTPEFLAMNSYHCVPTIKHGDFCMHESSAILRYICRAFPSKTSKYYGKGDRQLQVYACYNRIKLSLLVFLIERFSMMLFFFFCLMGKGKT